MQTKSIPRSHKPLALALVLAATPAVEAAYVIEQLNTNGNFGTLASGQSFTPNVGISPDPGPFTTINLTGFSLWLGAPAATNVGTSGTGLDTVYLNIFDGDPEPGPANFIGSSTNFFDFDSVTPVGQYTWAFSNLVLDYDTKYWAVFSSTNDGTGAGAPGINIQIQTGNPYAGGEGLIANSDSGGASDAKFSATFVPEPSSALPGGIGTLLLLRRRRV